MRFTQTTGAPPPQITHNYWLSGTAPAYTANFSLHLEVAKAVDEDFKTAKNALLAYAAPLQGNCGIPLCEPCYVTFMSDEQAQFACFAKGVQRWPAIPDGEYWIAVKYALPDGEGASFQTVILQK